jgi:hypothetical protein
MSDELKQARVEDAADTLAGGVRSFLSALSCMAPEALEFQARVKLAEPLLEYDQAVASLLRS